MTQTTKRTAQASGESHAQTDSMNQHAASLDGESGGRLSKTGRNKRYRVWHSSPNSEDMPHGHASFTVSGLDGDTLYECESLAANIERLLNRLSKRNAKRQN